MGTSATQKWYMTLPQYPYLCVSSNQPELWPTHCNYIGEFSEPRRSGIEACQKYTLWSSRLES